MTSAQRWLLRTASVIVAVLSLAAGFVGMGRFGEMRHQCPDGNQCVEARGVALTYLPVAILLGAFAAWPGRRSFR